ncbi:DUF6783 domain-containing protein [Blautia glucerasea]
MIVVNFIGKSFRKKWVIKNIPANCDVHLAESLFQTRSSIVSI